MGVRIPALKRVFLWLLVLLFLIPSPVWGSNGTACGMPCDCDTVFDNLVDPNLCCALKCMFGNLATFLITVSPFIAVALLAFGGVKYMASAGEEKSLLAAKQFLTWVILGFLAIFGVVFIFKLIISILGGVTGVNLPF